MGQYGLFLSELLPDVPFESDFSLQRHTTVGIGGTVCAFFPQTVRQLRALTRVCEKCRVRYFPLGGGSNVLPSDEGFDGVILSLERFNHVAVEGDLLTAESGVSVGKLLSVCKNHGLSGLEFLTGIPAQVGGITYMNAGTADGHVDDVIENVTFLQGNKIKTYSRTECRFSYKDSIFQHRSGVILSVRFRLTPASTESVATKIAAMSEKRRNLPKGKSMGCIFKNPAPSVSAGKLIEECGCKGMREGGAYVSEEHANFIINGGNASAADFCVLIGRIKEEVYARTGISLREEIRYIK